MLDFNSPEIKFISEAIRKAARLIRQVQDELATATLTKEDRSPVTVADFACQALVAEMLTRAFSADPLAAEEDASALRQPSGAATLEQVTRFVNGINPGATPAQTCEWIDYGRAAPAKRFWTLDPLDGTQGFLRGNQYVVALALVVEGQVQIGALGCPKLSAVLAPDMDDSGSLVIAYRGQGAWIAPIDAADRLNRLQVSDCRQAPQARLLRSVESGHTDVSKIDQFTKAMGISARPLPMDSQAKYVMLAGGKGEIVVRMLTPTKPEYREKIWDQTAGSLIVEEAGGQISDLDGKRLDFNAGRTLANNRGILATNGHLHPAGLQALRRVGA